jgi:hypothetical protein
VKSIIVFLAYAIGICSCEKDNSTSTSNEIFKYYLNDTLVNIHFTEDTSYIPNYFYETALVDSTDAEDYDIVGRIDRSNDLSIFMNDGFVTGEYTEDSLLYLTYATYHVNVVLQKNGVYYFLAPGATFKVFVTRISNETADGSFYGELYYNGIKEDITKGEFRNLKIVH